MQQLLHYTMHFILPGLVAYQFFKSIWKKAWLIMLATMIVDLDHLWADPIFKADRCSIGFHPLHSYYAIVIYILILLLVKNQTVRIIMVGLLLHMLTDYIDCIMMK